MKRLLACAPLAVALALAGCDGTTATDPLLRPSFDRGGGQGVNLRAGGFGEGSLGAWKSRSEEHTSELQSLAYLVCRLLLEKKKKSDRVLTKYAIFKLVGVTQSGFTSRGGERVEGPRMGLYHTCVVDRSQISERQQRGLIPS